jgi:hypothetical protein
VVAATCTARLPGYHFEVVVTAVAGPLQARVTAVAVCCSRASRVSVSSRAFSIAITAWAAKFCNSAICLSVKGRTSRR